MWVQVFLLLISPSHTSHFTGTPVNPCTVDAQTQVLEGFASEWSELSVTCPPPVVCLTGPTYNLSAEPNTGSWSGLGTQTGFAGWFFNPAAAGLGTHTLTYTDANGVSETCTVTVQDSFEPTLSLPTGWCQGDGPLLLDSLADPMGGVWTGNGVLATPPGAVFDAGLLVPGTYPVSYTTEGNCGGTVTGAISVYPSPEAPTVTALNGLLYAGNFAPTDSLTWLIDAQGEGTLYDMGFNDSIFYFPSWGDIFYVVAINEYGCEAISPPFLVDATIGLPPIQSEAQLSLWLDENGQLQSSMPLDQVEWHDALGRKLVGPIGPGPWLVHATAFDGHTIRVLLR